VAIRKCINYLLNTETTMICDRLLHCVKIINFVGMLGRIWKKNAISVLTRLFTYKCFLD